MSTQIISFAYRDLDLAPRRAVVTQSLGVVGAIPVPRNASLLRYADEVIVTDRRVIGVLGALGEAFAPLDLALKDFSPSALGDLAITDTAGAAYLWYPPAPPRRIWRATEPGAYFAVSIGDARLLVSRFAVGGEMQEAFAIDTDNGQVLWRLAPGYHIVAATPYGILAWTSSLDALQCFDPNTGALRWRAAAWDGGADLYGIVDGILWGPGISQLQRLDCSTGASLPAIPVEYSASPGGVIDDCGIFHCCRGLNYQTFDLRDSGRRLSFVEFRITAEGPTLGAGPVGMIVATDGRMIFSDQRYGIWVVHPERPAEPELVFRASGMVTGLLARRGQVLVAEAAGMITTLGVPLDEL